MFCRARQAIPTLLGLGLLIIGCAPALADAEIDRLLRSPVGKDWITNGGNLTNQRYSTLKQIDTTNVGKLKGAWMTRLKGSGVGGKYSFEASPLVKDGIMYVVTGNDDVFALNAKTGEIIWEYWSGINQQISTVCCGWVNRGLAMGDGYVYLGQLDANVVALDMKTGKVAWKTPIEKWENGYGVTSAPLYYEGIIYSGITGGEFGVRGRLTALDAKTGEIKWRWYTLPGPGDVGADTWPPGTDHAMRGGAAIWNTPALDPELGLVYFAVGNCGPDYDGSMREGDNLFCTSIVALKAKTGEYVWHFQSTPAESWDYTATQPLMLADLTIDGQPRKVVMQAPKNGFFYVLDRVTGEFISAQNYVNVTWTTGLDPKTGRPAMIPEARYLREPAMVAPGPVGAHNWYPMSYSPLTGLVYFSALESASYYKHDDKFEFRDRTWNTGLSTARDPANEKTIADAAKSSHGAFLIAWDPVKQQEAWRVSYQRSGNGGTLSTGGKLVFQGSVDGHLNAFAADSGAKLWSYDAQNAIMGGPITFQLDGEQYIATLAGLGGVSMTGALAGGGLQRSEYGRVVAFKIGGKAELPALQPTVSRVIPELRRANATGDAEAGQRNYDRVCAACHGASVRSVTSVPDLRYSPAIADAATFKSIVIDGVRAQKGMVGFASVLTPADAEAVRAYLVHMALAAEEAR